MKIINVTKTGMSACSQRGQPLPNSRLVFTQMNFDLIRHCQVRMLMTNAINIFLNIQSNLSTKATLGKELNWLV